MIAIRAVHLGLVLLEAPRLRLPLVGTALAEKMSIAAQAAGFGEKGTQALLEVLARAAERRESP